MHPQAFLARQHETGAAKVREMTRGFGLRNIQHRHQIADTEFAIAKQVQDAQPRAVGESAEHQVDGESFLSLEQLHTLKRI